MNVTIDEYEYGKACLELISKVQGKLVKFKVRLVTMERK